MKQSLEKNELHSTIQWGLLHVGLIWIYSGTVDHYGHGWQQLAQSPAAWYFLSGSGYVEADGGPRVSARTGQWLIVKPVTRFQYFSPDAKILSIRFRARWPDGEHLFFEGLSRCLDGKQYPKLLREALALERAARRYTRNKFNNISLRDYPMSFDAFLGIERQFLLWLEVLYRSLIAGGVKANLFEVEDPRLRQAIGMLRGWPLNQEYRVEDVAKVAGIGARQLERLFIQSLGVTSKKYMERRKYQFVQENLEGDLMSVKEIAFQVGFKHVPSFCRWYRKYAGRSASKSTVQ
jgi:AraC-like DNA-binding protein